MKRLLSVAATALSLIGTGEVFAQKTALPSGYEVIYCPHGGKGPYDNTESFNIYDAASLANSLEGGLWKHQFASTFMYKFGNADGINVQYYPSKIDDYFFCTAYGRVASQGFLVNGTVSVFRRAPTGKVCEPVGGYSTMTSPIKLPKGKEARFVCWKESEGEQPSKDTVVLDPKNPDPKQIEALLNSREPSETAKAILRAVEGSNLGELETKIEASESGEESVHEAGE
jgi:hypothetical protein